MGEDKNAKEDEDRSEDCVYDYKRTPTQKVTVTRAGGTSKRMLIRYASPTFAIAQQEARSREEEAVLSDQLLLEIRRAFQIQ